jgi:opacity protein-like surface antigen
MSMKKFVLAAATSAFALVAAASAQPGWYVSGQIGASLMPDQDLNNSLGRNKVDFDSGLAYGGALGYDIGNGFRLEADTMHQMSDVDRFDRAPAGVHLFSTSVMANATYDLATDLPFTPYVGAGIGAANIGGSIAGYSGSVWRPAYQLEAGLRDDISPRLSLFGEYRWQQSEAGKLPGLLDSGNQQFSDNLLTVGVAYHLDNNLF